MEDFERDRIRRDGMTRDRDLIIPQNQYTFVLDKTKGIVGVRVGPFKTSLAGTDQPVRYDEDKREFVEKAVGNQELAKVLAHHLPKAAGSFGLLTNKGGIDALMNMVKDTPLEEGLASLLSIDGNKTESKQESKQEKK